MWTKSYSITVPGIKAKQIWDAYTDINGWPRWHDDLEWTELKGSFKKGAIFYIKVKNGPKVRLEITECLPNSSFTDSTNFFLATMSDKKLFEDTKQGVRITNTLIIKGPLSFLWRKLVAEKVAADVPHEIEKLVQLVRESND